MLASALLEKLHAFFPDAAIDLVVRKGNDGLYTGHPFLRKLYVWDKRRGKTRDLFRLVRAFRKERYDHVINAQRFFSTGLMTVLSGGKETVGYDKNPLSFLFSRTVKHQIPAWQALRGKDPQKGAPHKHEVDRLNDLIVHLTDGERPLPRLYPTEEAREKVRAWVQHGGTEEAKAESGKLNAATTPAYITIAPASVWFTKQWPAEKWIELIRLLPEDRRVFLIGGPADAALCGHIAKQAGRGEVLAGRLSLAETAALMEGAAMNYVNDSGPLHIASATDAPVTAVFCSTVPAFGFGPLRPNGRVVQHDGPLYCRPCGLHGLKTCPEGHFKCAREIDVHALTTPHKGL
ncbi:MAG: glycosyltransferase family 9 protein [Flavobacteriales bacterium]|nr:glycosyltransferase family 9 protein [Flavobacteriales bacterium]MEB2342069.1 glycosyltransferase family 9 protein [Flavobacteriia bacterium]